MLITFYPILVSVPISSSCNFWCRDQDWTQSIKRTIRKSTQDLDTFHKKNTNPGLDTIYKRTLTLDGTPSIITEDLRNCI